MFTITETARTTALWACLVAIAALILGLGASLIDPTSPLFRGAVFVGAAFGFIAVMVVLAGAVNAREARAGAHARAEPKPPSDCTTCGEPGCSMPDGPEDDPTVRALAEDPRLMEAYNRMESAVAAVESTTRARMGMAEVTAKVNAETMSPYAGLESQLATNAAGWPRGRLQDAQWLERELTAYRTTSPARADAVLRAQRQHRMDYWHERATAMLEEGNVRGAMADIVRSAADSLDPKLVKGVATRLVEDVDAFVHPLLLPSSGREAGIAELAVLSDTRLFAGQATRQLARMVEELCDRNAELAGRVVSGIGHAAAAQARANEEAIDPEREEADTAELLERVDDGALMQEAVRRGLVRFDTMPGNEEPR